MTVKLFQFHALPWVRIPSTRPGCSKHLPAPFSLSFVIVQKAQDLQWCKFPMILFFWRCARNILQQMNIKHCVISNIIFKKTLILESFLGRQQKSFRLRGCKWILLHQQVKEIRALKQSLKWKWDFLAIKFPSSTLHPDQCFGIKQLSTYPTPAYWPVTKRKSNVQDICVPWLQLTTLQEMAQRAFFPQKGIRIHMRNSWKSHAEIPCDLSRKGNADSELTVCLPLILDSGTH